ncbi:MAG: secondary thiamine-phosphate synthase enzyme YjbQ [candidate division Zixibacteria bacterium]|nr:secondary thiamine-phosphate synthase enzyme YjbQ [candidate division Zixibacteria bacterium]
MNTLTVETQVRRQMIDVTARVQEIVTESGRRSGFVICFVPHTTAAITINENADPDVTRDILYKLGKEIPPDDGYHHMEGNSDAHIQASLLGASQQILFENRRLVLGRWQAVYFCEFDGPRQRRLIVEVMPLA